MQVRQAQAGALTTQQAQMQAARRLTFFGMTFAAAGGATAASFFRLIWWSMVDSMILPSHPGPGPSIMLLGHAKPVVAVAGRVEAG